MQYGLYEEIICHSSHALRVSKLLICFFGPELHLPTPAQSLWDLWWTKWQQEGCTPSTSVFTYRYNSTNAPCSYFTHISLMLYTLCSGEHR